MQGLELYFYVGATFLALYALVAVMAYVAIEWLTGDSFASARLASVWPATAVGVASYLVVMGAVALVLACMRRVLGIEVGP